MLIIFRYRVCRGTPVNLSEMSTRDRQQFTMWLPKLALYEGKVGCRSCYVGLGDTRMHTAISINITLLAVNIRSSDDKLTRRAAQRQELVLVHGSVPH
jgi:hypothetical protein